MNLPSSMRALRLEQLGQLTEVVLPVPKPRTDEVLIRTCATTICTSDLNDIQHNPFGIALPRVLGHEGVGTVAAVGEQVGNFHIGDRVAGHPVIPCGQCVDCRRGLGHLCEQMGHLGLDRDGTFAEYYCLRADRVRSAPLGLDLAVAALLEPVAVCLEAIERAGICPGDTVLIVGDGPFGIIIARLAFARKPKRVIIVGRHDFRLRQVPRAIPIQEHIDTLKSIRHACESEGADVAILAVGNQSALDLCVASLRARGRLVVFSAVHDRPRVDLLKVHVKELAILGACNDENYLDAALQCLSDPALSLETMITHRVSFDQWPRAFDLARNGKDHALKVALTFGASA